MLDLIVAGLFRRSAIYNSSFIGGNMFGKQYALAEVNATLQKDLQQACGKDLLALLYYGSEASSQFLNADSDHNYLVVLAKLGPDALVKLAPLQNSWKKRFRVSPLFLTRDDIVCSCDVFPIEFLNIKSTYTIVFGEDIFQKLDIPLTHLRTQCEQSLKGKLIILRQGFLEDPRQAVALIRNSLPAYVLVFKNILSLLGETVPANSLDVFKLISAKAGLDEKVFSSLSELAKGKRKASGKEGAQYFGIYIQELHKLSEYIDKLSI
ncbi:MAG: hypothetical protein WC838_07035 [Candidatus Margulisiibacteriota bacterium]|jgi:hypothetical protein